MADAQLRIMRLALPSSKFDKFEVASYAELSKEIEVVADVELEEEFVDSSDVEFSEEIEVASNGELEDASDVELEEEIEVASDVEEIEVSSNVRVHIGARGSIDICKPGIHYQRRRC